MMKSEMAQYSLGTPFSWTKSSKRSTMQTNLNLYILTTFALSAIQSTYSQGVKRHELRKLKDCYFLLTISWKTTRSGLFKRLWI